MSRFGTVLAGGLLLLLPACKDYGEFTVAERRWVDDEAFPALSEIDLREINMEFAIGSELHARLAPDAWWPQPIRALLDQARRNNGGELPEEFDLPIPDACIYVDADPKSSRFRRLRSKDRKFLFVSSVLGREPWITDSKIAPEPQIRSRLAIIAEGRQPSLMGSFPLASFEFEVIVRGKTAYIFTALDASLFMTSVDVSNSNATVKERDLIFEADTRIDRIQVDAYDDVNIDVAVLTDRYKWSTERKIYFDRIDTSDFSRDDFDIVTETASKPVLYMRSLRGSTLISWIDARFIERGFDRRNFGKIMISKVSPSGTILQPLALNAPNDSDDDAFTPFLASYSNDTVFASWRTTPGDWRDGPVQASVVDVGSNNLVLRNSSLPFSEVREEALIQQTAYQRSMPLPHSPYLSDEYCDSWLERLPDKGVRVLDPITRKPVRPWR